MQWFAVEITKKDGATFLASAGIGNGPAVWACQRNRKFAVQHKKELQAKGFKCRVVEIEYTEPVVIGPK